MKRIIRYLARISGVEAEIVRKSNEDVVGQIEALSEYLKDEPRVKSMLDIISVRTKLFGHFRDGHYLSIIYKQNFPEPENLTK